jgi:hypothetical protein
MCVECNANTQFHQTNTHANQGVYNQGQPQTKNGAGVNKDGGASSLSGTGPGDNTAEYGDKSSGMVSETTKNSTNNGLVGS